MAKYTVCDNVLSDTNRKLAPKLQFTGWEFRKEYQSQCIASILDGLETEVPPFNAQKFHLGCGAGKTSIFLLSLLLGIHNKRIKKSLISAPRLALIFQHIAEIDTMINYGKENGVFSQDFKLKVVEISSNGAEKSKLKSKDLEIFNLEHDELEDLEELKELTSYKHINYVCSQNKDDVILDALNANEVTIFIACQPSLFRFIQGPLRKVDTKIFDLVIHDEYHNLVSQNKKTTNKVDLEFLSKRTYLSTYFSATPRRGAKGDSVMCCNNNVFGKEEPIANITTASLKEWGYLKPKLVVNFIIPRQVYNISDAEQSILEGSKINAQKFFREAAIIKRVMTDRLEDRNAPHILVATSRVAIIKKLVHKKSNFIEGLKGITKKLFVSQLNGGTYQDIREQTFRILNNASTKLATLTLQHSIISEGINITNFNTAIVLRGMSNLVLNQFVNRITRTHKDYDTAYLYIKLDEGTEVEYEKKLVEFLSKLWNMGLTFADMTIEVTCEDPGSGPRIDEDPDPTGFLKMKDVKTRLENVILEQQKEIAKQEMIEKIEAMTSLEELFVPIYKKKTKLVMTVSNYNFNNVVQF